MEFFSLLDRKILFRVVSNYAEYIFPWPRKVCPRDRTEVKTDFFFREKVLLSEIVGKKDRVEQLSNRAERLSSRAKRGKTAKRS